MIDFIVQNEGSIFLLHPHGNEASRWIEEHIGADNGYQPYWPIVLVEHRYIQAIIDGIHSDRLTVSAWRQ